MLETQFWNLLKKHLPGDVSRIENSADDGTPDVTGAWKHPLFEQGIDYWIELKVCNNKTKLREPVSLCKDSQLVWHHRRGREGSLIYVMVRYQFAIMTYRWAGIHGYYQPIYRGSKDKNRISWVEFEFWFQEELKNQIKRRL